MLRIGVITAYAREDASSARLIRACRQHGLVVVLEPARLSFVLDDGTARVFHTTTELGGFDVVLLVRGLGPGGDFELQLDLYRALEQSGARLTNRIEPLLLAQDKLRTTLRLSACGVTTPDAAAIQREEDGRRVIARLGRAVAKPLFGSLGEGVELLPEGRLGFARAARILARRGSLYLQAYTRGTDVRAFVVGERVEAAIAREAPDGDFRGNLSVGGVARAIELGPEAAALAVAASRAIGLDWAGVDLVLGRDGPTVIEVNGSPNWEGILQVTGRDMAEAIAAFAVMRAKTARHVAASEHEEAAHGDA